jgi:hypothetical protein
MRTALSTQHHTVCPIALQDSHGIPASEQLLIANGRLLSNTSSTLAAAGLQDQCSITLLLRLCGGKGGFGALLRGQGRDGKITDNFDAMRDLSGRRIRHVEAEKKLQEWKQDAKERELEVIAMRHMKEMAKQAKAERDFQVGGALQCMQLLVRLQLAGRVPCRQEQGGIACAACCLVGDVLGLWGSNGWLHGHS